MSNCPFDLALTDFIDIESDLRGEFPVASTECLDQLTGMGPRYVAWFGHANTSQILRLKAQVTPAHPNPVGGYKEIHYGRYQKPPKHFEVPVVRLDEIKIVVRIGLATV